MLPFPTHLGVASGRDTLWLVVVASSSVIVVEFASPGKKWPPKLQNPVPKLHVDFVFVGQKLQKFAD